MQTFRISQTDFKDNNKPQNSNIHWWCILFSFAELQLLIYIFRELSDFLETENAWKIQCSLSHNTYILSVYILIRMAVYVVLLGYSNTHSHIAFACARQRSLSTEQPGGFTVVKVPLYSNFPHAFRRKT